jgi:hypothetical protein
MAGEIHQLTQRSCTSCGMGGIIPREESSYDRFSQETIVEAVWVCHRCGSRFGSGVVSRTKDNEKK